MSGFGEPKKEPAVDMNRFRKDLGAMFREMQRTYRAEGFVYRTSDGILKFRKVPFPEVELVRQKRTEDAI